MKTKLLFFLAFAFAAVNVIHAQTVQTPLDGNKYKIDFMKDGKTESTETLIFQGSKLQTPDCAKYGFTDGLAYVKPTKDYFTWSSSVKSETEGVMAWQGSVKGENIEGTCVWRKAGQDPTNYTFKGTLIKEGQSGQK